MYAQNESSGIQKSSALLLPLQVLTSTNVKVRILENGLEKDEI